MRTMAVTFTEHLPSLLTSSLLFSYRILPLVRYKLTKSTESCWIDVDQPLKPNTSFARFMTIISCLRDCRYTFPSFDVAILSAYFPSDRFSLPQFRSTPRSRSLSDILRPQFPPQPSLKLLDPLFRPRSASTPITHH